MTDAETIRALKHFERPARSTGEWLDLERKLRERIADLEQVNRAMAEAAYHRDTHGLDLDAEANTRVTELEGRLRNYQIAVVAMGSVAVTIVGGFLWRMI
jgi:transcription elongation GreA/GreB family factor